MMSLCETIVKHLNLYKGKYSLNEVQTNYIEIWLAT